MNKIFLLNKMNIILLIFLFVIILLIILNIFINSKEIVCPDFDSKDFLLISEDKKYQDISFKLNNHINIRDIQDFNFDGKYSWKFMKPNSKNFLYDTTKNTFYYKVNDLKEDKYYKLDKNTIKLTDLEHNTNKFINNLLNSYKNKQWKLCPN